MAPVSTRETLDKLDHTYIAFAKTDAIRVLQTQLRSRDAVRPPRVHKEPVMSTVRFVGLDVHADTIAVAVAEPGGEVAGRDSGG